MFLILLCILARPAGVEPATLAFGGLVMTLDPL